MPPVFPNFRKLKISDLELIENFTKKSPPFNDFDTVDLLIFNPGNKTTFSILNNNLIIRRQSYISENFLYTFLGTYKIKDTLLKLLKKSKEENLGEQLVHIPEMNIKSSSNLHKYFLIEEDPDNFDYILSVNDLAELTGSRFHNKRNLVKMFKKQCPDYTIKSLDLTKNKINQEINELFLLWEMKKNKERSETKIELEAIQKLYILAKKLKIYCMGVYLKSQLIGFTTYHLPREDYAAITFEKGDTSYNGIYSFLNHETAKHLRTLGIKHINFEQHFGIPGLKKAKNLWRPIFFLKKYIISKRR